MTFSPRYHSWSSEEVLSGSIIADSELAGSLIAESREYLFHDMCAEYDSANLSDYLATSNIELSNEFWNMCEVWLKDEQNHYVGLRRINNLLYAESVEDLDRRVKSRKCCFDAIEHLISDEFKILVCIAFDEIVSARSYAYDREEYEIMGGDHFLQWVKYAGRDEGCHANNALTLLVNRHGDNLHKVRDHVRQICEYELVGDIEYHGTFLFDHDASGEIPKDMLVDAGRTLCSFFEQGEDFEVLLKDLELDEAY